MKRGLYYYSLLLFVVALFSSVYALFLQSLLLSGLLLLLSLFSFFSVLHFRGVMLWSLLRSVFFSQQVRWHAVQLRELLLVLVGLLMFYFVSLQATSDFQIDLTSEKIYSLTPRTKQLLQQQKKEILIRYFRTLDSADIEARTILQKFASGKKIKLETIDLVDNHSLARLYGVEKSGEVLLFVKTDQQKKWAKKEEASSRQNGDLEFIQGSRQDNKDDWHLALRFTSEDFRPRRLASLGGNEFYESLQYEPILANAIYTLASVQAEEIARRRLIFLTSWPQENLKGNSGAAYHGFSQLAQSKGFDLHYRTLNISDDLFLNDLYNGVDAQDVLVVVDASRQFPVRFEGLLAEHFTNGGKMMLMLEPEIETVSLSTTTGARGLMVGERDESIENFLEQFGVENKAGVIVDSLNVNPYYRLLSDNPLPFPRYPALFYASEHPITATLQAAKLSPFFSGTTGFAFLPFKSGSKADRQLLSDRKVETTALLGVSEQAWVEKSYAQEMKLYGEPRFNLAEDTTVGDAVVALLSHRLGGRTLVFGDGDFLRDRLFYVAGNRALVERSLHWLFDEKTVLPSAEYPPKVQPVNYSFVEKRNFVLAFFVLLPSSFLALAIALQLRRRMANKLK